jgi:hypothetical protein
MRNLTSIALPSALAALAALAVVAAPSLAAADDRPVVLAVDGADVYVDLGGLDGVTAGAELELLHMVVAKDPTTGASLRDEFSLGTMTVERAGDHVALARADGELTGRVVAGDRVRLVGEAAPMRDPWVARVEASAQPRGGARVPPAPTTARGAADAEAVRSTWQATLGTALPDRAAVWRGFLREHPDTAYAQAIKAEITNLERQEVARQEAIARSARPGAGRGERIAALAMALDARGGALDAMAPVRVGPGQAVDLAILVRMPDAIGAAALFARRAGDEGYKRIELAKDGDSYLRGRIPAELVAEPRVEWFVEATGPDGVEGAGIGTRSAPQVIAVDHGVAEEPPATGRTAITLALDYVDFDGGLADGFDQYVQAEMDFMYRFIEPIYAFRIGFGTLSGIGGPKDIIDEDESDRCLDAGGIYRCRRVTFNYVYAEIEHRFRPNVALMVRPTAGLVATDLMQDSDATRCTDSDDIDNCDFAAGFGLRARVRLGEETATNLVLGAGFTDGVGTVLEARYHWLPTKVMPVELSVEVTDQPVPENFGVRLIGDVGWRGLSWFYPSIRLSMQARDIDHTGFSGGAAMNFDW